MTKVLYRWDGREFQYKGLETIKRVDGACSKTIYGYLSLEIIIMERNQQRAQLVLAKAAVHHNACKGIVAWLKTSTNKLSFALALECSGLFCGYKFLR